MKIIIIFTSFALFFSLVEGLTVKVNNVHTDHVHDDVHTDHVHDDVHTDKVNVPNDADVKVLVSDILNKEEIDGIQGINWNNAMRPNGQTVPQSGPTQRAPVFLIPIIAIFKSLATKAVIVKSGAIATKAFIAIKAMFTAQTATAIGSKVLLSLVAAKVTQVTEKLLTRWFSDQVSEKSVEIINEWNQLKEKEKDSLVDSVREAINEKVTIKEQSSGGTSNGTISEEERKLIAINLVNFKLS